MPSNSLAVARAVLRRNGVPAARVHTLEATAHNDIQADAPIDVVVSLLSWGFHYPVATYIDTVYEKLHRDGVVILDVRKGTDGLDVLRQKFPHMAMVCETNKRYRVAVNK